jgi:hypothetical protein
LRRPDFEEKKMLTEKQAAEAYREMSDSTGDLLRVRHDARRERRVKPDPEVNPLAELDYEKGATWNEQTPQATPLRASTCA